ncbi:MAG TPA: esterase [Bdellovibrionales bacterium]|nr:esterase [Pseudobdellovibrionaceae bacterium]HAG91219.1 esterase [Bdellovibrionales bacterium]|tara:strand:- start:3497 stop:4183 length:687 start_codon:yes stop_codon:yes gene_type:complete
MSRLRVEQIAGIETLIKDSDRQTDDGPAVVLFHGFGADAQDLASLVPMLNIDDRLSFYFPEGPLEVPIGFGQMGRAWFPIPLSQLTDGFDFEDIRPEGLNGIVKKVERFISNLPHEEIILGGFSQGSMLTTHLFLKNPSRFKGLVALSGTLCNRSEWQSFCDHAKERPPVFQTHGHFDPILTFHQAQKLNDFLRKNDFPNEFYGFNGQHEIPMEAIRRLKLFIARVLF